MKIALAQVAPNLGDIKKNLELHLNHIENAKKKGVDLIVFPELSLTGYTLKDLVHDVAISPATDPHYNKLLSASRNISITFGFVEQKDRGLLYNSAAFLSGGKTLHIHRKVYLPTYGMFEEGKFFTQGKNFRTFSIPQGRAGLMICYDFLHYGASYLLFAGGSEIIIILSAAPGRGLSEEPGYTSSYQWELMAETISRFSSAFVVFCNRVGIEDGKCFAGGSFIFNPAGELIAKASYVDEDYIVQEIDLNEIQAICKKSLYKRDEKPEIILESLKRIVRNYED